MSKGLEAFNRILGNDYFNLIITSRTNGKKQYAHDIAIVKKELKRLEELDNGAYAPVHINRYNELCDKEEALNEILALHDKWLGNEMSDFEFFTLLSEVKDKYGLSKEVLDL